MSWTVTVWRGGLETAEEEWPPLDAEAAWDVLGRVAGGKREGPDEWSWEGEGGVSALVIFYEPLDRDEPNEISVVVTFEPGTVSGKRADLRVLGEALFEIARRVDGVFGESERRVFATLEEFVETGIAKDPWRREDDPPPRTHVTRRELFGRLLRRD